MYNKHQLHAYDMESHTLVIISLAKNGINLNEKLMYVCYLNTNSSIVLFFLIGK